MAAQKTFSRPSQIRPDITRAVREMDCPDCRAERNAITAHCAQGHLSLDLCDTCFDLSRKAKNCDTCGGFGSYDVQI